MAHLSEDQLYDAVFEDLALPQEVERHLQECEECRKQHLQIERLQRELEIARRSQPTLPQLERYYQLFSEVGNSASLWSQVSDQVQMVLRQDGRYQVGLQGLRAVGPRAYRLLFTAQVADVELLVETHGQERRIQGEVVPFDSSELIPPVLVELRRAEQSVQPTELVVESTEQGRFHFAGITLGNYQLTITPLQGPALYIGGIDIT